MKQKQKVCFRKGALASMNTQLGSLLWKERLKLCWKIWQKIPFTYEQVFHTQHHHYH